MNAGNKSSGASSNEALSFVCVAVIRCGAAEMEKEVTLWCHVLPNGQVKDDISVKDSSGYKDVDNLAVEVLRKWNFSSIEEQYEQSGQITFKFKL